MQDDSLAYDLESLKTAAREAQDSRTQSKALHDPQTNRTDIVHAGYRLLQCAAAAIIFIYHITVELTEKLPDAWDMTFVIVYPGCFVASFVLAIIRIMNFLPNPAPIIPVAVSVIGWAAMLIGAILAMRHANLHLHIETMTDDEVAMDPVFRHDLLLCSLSLVGSSVYLVHAWLCYDCWKWDVREKKMKEESATSTAQASESNSMSESNSRMSSNDEIEQNYQSGNPPALTLPGTSTDHGKPGRSGRGKSSKLFKKLRKPVKMKPMENDTLTILKEILGRSTGVKEIDVEDEPVRLYCCCVDFGNLIMQKYKTHEPVHEFQVVHVM